MSGYPVVVPGPKVDRDGVRLRRGGCSCGAVRFEVRGEPDVVGICHCLECRMATGAVAMVYAKWPRVAFSSTGEAREYVGRSFCAICGSRLFHLNPTSVGVVVGALDDAPSDLVPTQEGWIKRREPWLPPLTATEQSRLWKTHARCDRRQEGVSR
jgi:hypothetical protein